MEVVVTHHVDEAEGMRYEYDLYEFTLGARLVRARRYIDQDADEIAVLGMLDDAQPGAPHSLYEVPEAQDIVASLKSKGFQRIFVLGPQGYAVLDETRLEQHS